MKKLKGLKDILHWAAYFFRKNTGFAIREAGLELDRKGSISSQDIAFLEPLNRHRNVLNLDFKSPTLAKSVYVAPNATVFGQVWIARNSYVGFGAVINGIHHPVRIGTDTKVGDNCSLQSALFVPDEAFPISLNIGNYVNIQHNCVLFGSIVDDYSHIGFGTTVMEGAQLERGY